MTINWEQLGRQIGSIHAAGEHGGDEVGRQALAEILGRDCIEQAVEAYLNAEPGSAIIRSVLILLRSEYAVSKCVAIYEHDTNPRHRRSAVELLRGFAPRELRGWVGKVIGDPDEGAASWGMSLVDELVARGEIAADEAEPLVQLGESHRDAQVRRTAALIREHLAMGQRT